MPKTASKKTATKKSASKKTAKKVAVKKAVKRAKHPSDPSLKDIVKGHRALTSVVTKLQAAHGKAKPDYTKIQGLTDAALAHVATLGDDLNLHQNHVAFSDDEADD